MVWSASLRRELSVRNQQLALANALAHELTSGETPSVIFGHHAGQHGNFHPRSYRNICANPQWARRLRKVHTASRKASPATGWRWKELDCANSSDALLMNIFCYGRTLRNPTLVSLLGTERGATPEFGFRPAIPLSDGKTDRTEIDMRVGDLLVDAQPKDDHPGREYPSEDRPRHPPPGSGAWPRHRRSPRLYAPRCFAAAQSPRTSRGDASEIGAARPPARPAQTVPLRHESPSQSQLPQIRSSVHLPNRRIWPPFRRDLPPDRALAPSIKCTTCQPPVFVELPAPSVLAAVAAALVTGNGRALHRHKRRRKRPGARRSARTSASRSSRPAPRISTPPASVNACRCFARSTRSRASRRQRRNSPRPPRDGAGCARSNARLVPPRRPRRPRCPVRGRPAEQRRRRNRQLDEPYRDELRILTRHRTTCRGAGSLGAPGTHSHRSAGAPAESRHTPSLLLVLLLVDHRRPNGTRHLRSSRAHPAPRSTSLRRSVATPRPHLRRL